MNIYVLDFEFFSGVDWANKRYKIIATSMEDLEKEVREKLTYMNINDSQEQKWQEIKKDIEIENSVIIQEIS